MNKLFIMVLVLISLNTWASLSGNWIGTGEWTYEGAGTRCYMNLSFRDTEKILIRKETKFDCGVVALDVPEGKFIKEGETLKNEEGDIIGSYIGNIIKYTESYNENVRVESTIIVNGNHFDYEEIWKMQDDSILYIIRGRFFTNR